MNVDAQSILVVDDDDILRSRLEKAFSSRGYQVKCANGYDEALLQLEVDLPDLAVVDLKMPGHSGLELLKEISQRSPQTRTVVLTGYGSITNAVEAVKLGAVNYVTKPADADQLLAAFDSECDPDPTHPPSYNPQSLAEAQWGHIQRVLNDCGGNISEAARLLDIPRRTLQRKLKKNAP